MSPKIVESAWFEPTVCQSIVKLHHVLNDVVVRLNIFNYQIMLQLQSSIRNISAQYIDTLYIIDKVLLKYFLNKFKVRCISIWYSYLTWSAPPYKCSCIFTSKFYSVKLSDFRNMSVRYSGVLILRRSQILLHIGIHCA